MSYQTFVIEVNGNVAELRFCRQERANAQSVPMFAELAAAFGDLGEREEVRALVISAEGRHFCGGFDVGSLAEFQAADGDRGRVAEQFRRMIHDFQHVFWLVHRCRVPVLGAIQGACIGGGLDFATWFDMRYCSAEAFFAVQEINIGFVADGGTLQRLPELIPPGLARELAFTGRRMLADEALRCGLVNRVYPDAAALRAGVLEIAAEIAQRSPLAVAGTKEMLNYARDHGLADAMDHVATWQAAMFFSEDAAEAARARSEERPPRFAPLLPRRPVLRRQ